MVRPTFWQNYSDEDLRREHQTCLTLAQAYTRAEADDQEVREARRRAAEELNCICWFPVDHYILDRVGIDWSSIIRIRD